ncbi:MAG: ABC transporter permease [Acidimicrobiales bacterium]
MPADAGLPDDVSLPGRHAMTDARAFPLSSPGAAAEALSGVGLPPEAHLTPAGPEGGEVATTGGALRQIARVFVENKLAIVGLGVIIFMVLFCFVGPLLYHTNQVNAQAALQGSPASSVCPPCAPSNGHLLGTDDQNFDILGRLMFGGKNSLIVGFVAALAATIFGVVYGAVSGFVGGWLDALMMRVIDILLSIPQLFLLIVLAVIFHPSLHVLIEVIAVVAWLVPGRLIRGETLTLRVREYVQAVRVMGGSRTRIIFRHIIPNTVGTIVVNATFQVADAILLLAALGFLGLGLPAPQTDWGAMLSNGVNYATDGYWWLIYPAGFCIVIVVVAFNFVGDALRDSLEVRLQQR